MRLAARDPNSFRNDPYGGFIAGEAWLYFAFDPSVFGYVLWGAPEAEDMRALAASLARELHRPPHAAIVDLTDVSAIEPESFDVLAECMREHHEALGRVVTRAALVHPTGMNGAIVSGFFSVVPPPFPVTVFADTAAALASLGHAASAEGAEAMRNAQAEVTAVPRPLRDLRAYVEAHLAEPTLDDAARAIGVSARTLQRRLNEWRTSFIDEVADARIRTAQRLLLRTGTPITTIALDVGYSSAQHFSSSFRRRVGKTPSEYRADRTRR